VSIAKRKENGRSMFLARYSERYLYGKYENGVQAGGRIAYVKLFSIIAVVILVIACINFMNLSTAKAARRIKEVGIKKVVGASRRDLIFQYLGESMLMTLLSLALAIFLIIALLPVFNEITGKQMYLDIDARLASSLLGIVLFLLFEEERPFLAGATVLLAGFTLPGSAAVLALVIVATAATLGAFWAPAMAMLSDAAEAFGLDQALAAALMNLAWAGGQIVGSGAGGAVAKAAGDTVPTVATAGLCGATLLALSARGLSARRV